MSDREMFTMFDADGDGAINAIELSHVLYALGCNPTVKECEAMAAQCPDPQRIDYATFQHILAQAPRPDRSAEQHLLEAFRVFDKNEDGLIPENDLRVIFTTLGETCDIQDVNHLLKAVKVDENGKVRYADFVKIILK